MSETNNESTVTMCDGKLRAWIEQESIHIRAIDDFGDPLELSAHEAQKFAQQLLNLTAKIE